MQKCIISLALLYILVATLKVLGIKMILDLRGFDRFQCSF